MTKTIAQIRAEAAAHYNGEGGFDNSSRKNAYECGQCGSYIVTVDLEPGVTPFMVSCGTCGAGATSKFYRVHASLTPTHEWYRPEAFDGLSRWAIDHVEKGGLLLRQIGGGHQNEGWQHPGDGLAAAKRELDAAHIEEEKRAAFKRMAECVPDLDRSKFANRQQYRAALRQAGKPRRRP